MFEGTITLWFEDEAGHEHEADVNVRAEYTRADDSVGLRGGWSVDSAVRSDGGPSGPHILYNAKCALERMDW